MRFSGFLITFILISSALADFRNEPNFNCETLQGKSVITNQWYGLDRDSNCPVSIYTTTSQDFGYILVNAQSDSCLYKLGANGELGGHAEELLCRFSQKKDTTEHRWPYWQEY